MSLPININNLLTGQVVEWDRLEFKEGWNPLDAVQTICAFANDFHNWGGGYLIFGIAEKDGRPELPPKGLSPEEVDKAQRKLLELGHLIRPHYHPICEPVEYQNKLILVVWVSGGEMRPYKAPVSLDKEKKEMAYFIRLHANTVQARGEIELELINLANRIPFDDRQHPSAAVSELRPSLIRSFLSEIGSDLTNEALDLNIDDLGRRLQIVRGPDEQPRPLNVGLLFFSSDPCQWFPQTQIDVVQMPDGPGGNTLIENTFSGPIGSMLRDALAYLKNSFITEYVQKFPHQEKAERYFNVPYSALEESIANAVYHRSYEEREPIEIRITPDEVTVLSFPGPDRSIDMNQLRAGRAVARRYRNRRIGEFLKELDLTEGRSTGIPKILQAMLNNGSDEPEFETDLDRTSFLVRLPLRDAPAKNAVPGPIGGEPGVELGVESGVELGGEPNMALSILELLKDLALSKSELAEKLGKPKPTRYINDLMVRLRKAGLVKFTVPDNPTSPMQKYQLTKKGQALLPKHHD
jgi:ATP-dependent DNA helicase RecG